MLSWLVDKLWSTPLDWLRRVFGVNGDGQNVVNVEDHDHPLVKDYTEFNPYTTSHAKYPQIRSFYHPHAHADKLKAIADLPLLVVVHGLGGSLPQFAPLLGSLVNLAPTFGIELPGHGLSEFAPRNYEAYTFEALVELWKVAIEDVCRQHGHRKVVLVGHSLGCSLAASLVSMASELRLDVEVLGLIAICPKATPPTKSQASKYRRMLSLPDFILDILRWFDRLGDEKSASVKRFVGDAAGVDLKRLQLRFNKQFQTPVWKRTSIGLLPEYDKFGVPHGGIPGHEVWQAAEVPLCLIAGESDAITKASEASLIAKFVQGKSTRLSTSSQSIPIVNGVTTHKDNDENASPRADDTRYGAATTSMETKSKHSLALKLVTLPAPASHALMYDHSTYRTVAGLVEDFLAKHVSDELSLGWQLQQLTTSGKWDVKNLQKWKKVLPVSGPIDGGFFRALKTLREQDEEHTPSVFLERWGSRIFAVIDISHDSPVYDTKALENGGIEYHKFPTVSKIPPTLVEVQNFIVLVEKLRAEIDEKYENKIEKPAIAVHCHYGYNRTGFFIICYLIEKRGYRVQDAIEEFAQAKPPGIKHDHFIDTLFVRYCVGLRRNSTFR